MKFLRQGSLCRVKRPEYQGKLALGKVNSIKLFYPDDGEPYAMVFVEMLLDCSVKLFCIEEIEAMPSVVNGFDNELEFDKVAA